MIVDCQIARIIHSNESFQLLGAIPIGEHELVLHPTYRTFTIKDTGHRLVVNKNYTLEVEEQPPNKYGTQYLLKDIPSLSFDKIDDITDDMELELLQEIMNEKQAKYVHEAYPNFIRLVMKREVDKINVDNIYNVSTKRLDKYINKVGKKYNAFLLQAQMKDIELTQDECTALLEVCVDIDGCVELVNERPYYALINICGRGFRGADVMILSHDIKHKESKERIEYMLQYAIEQFELDGSTYVDAIRIGDYIASIDSGILPMIKDVAIESEMITYNEERNILQRTSTYEQELRIANFFKTIALAPHVLDWDWEKYTTIKDGELTEEQRGLLGTFCESRVVVLDSPAGTGKSSSVMALIDMIEDNDMTYIMMSPTGKAASRLSQQTGRDASTIHRAVLGNMLYDKDVIIVDEASMLSLPLIDMIISSELLSNCRLVFVGDSAQIPPIGLGRVFKDMSESGAIPVVRLTKCFRFEEGGASYVSTLTRQGQFYMTEEQMGQERFTLGQKQDYEFIRFNGDVNQIIDVYMSLIEDGINPKDIMLLVPYNIGSFGATKLNNMIQERLNPVGDDEYMKTKHNNANVFIHRGDLVMNIKNNYNAVTLRDYRDIEWDDSFELSDAKNTAVYNGQTGYVESVTNERGVVSGKMLVANIEGEDIVYTSSDINNLLLSYASNPYKYQGSQNKYIINVIIGAHDKAWNRQLLYTSQTRMTDKLIEIGDIDMIREAVSQAGDDNRNTRLKEFLTLS